MPSGVRRVAARPLPEHRVFEPMPMKPSVRFRLVAALAAVGLAGCASPVADRFLGVVTPYKIEVVQGNVVTSEQAALVKVGMARAQVRDVLGSPLLSDIFHEDRWDYVFTIRRPGAPVQSRRVTVRFDGDKLASIEAPDLPSEREFVDSIDTTKRAKSTAPLSLTDAQIKQLPTPAQAGRDASGPAVVPAARSYPPLSTQ